MSYNRPAFSGRRGQSMGYWIADASIQDPGLFVAGICLLARSGYKIVRVMLRNSNYTHLSPEVVAAVDAGARAAADLGIRVVLDVEPHSLLGREMGQLFPGSTSTLLVPVKTRLFHGKFTMSVQAPSVTAHMPIWDGIECAFVQNDGAIVRLNELPVSIDWESVPYPNELFKRSHPYVEGKPVASSYVCHISGQVPGHSSETLIFYARFADITLVDFWSPGFRAYYSKLIDAYRNVPLAGIGWDEPAIGGNWNAYRYGASFAQAFAQRNGYSLADRAYLLDWPETTPESARVRLDYYETLNEGLRQAHELIVAEAKDVFGDNLLLGTHHTWQGEGGINDYRAGAVDYFSLASTQDAGYTDCCWWDEKSVLYAYVLGTSLGRLTPSGETEVNTWHFKPTNSLVKYNARLMSLFNVVWFNLWFGDNADTCQYPGHYTWAETQLAVKHHDAVQERLVGLAPLADVAVWHGWEGVTAINDAGIAGAHKTFTMNISKLYTERNVAFDFIDSALLAGSSVDGGRLVTKLGRYRVLVLPYAAVLPEVAWSAVETFAAAGGRVVFVGPPPSFTTDGKDLTARFGKLLGLTSLLPLSDYLGEIAARYSLHAGRPDYLDCSVSLEAYSDRVEMSVERDASAAVSPGGNVVYISDLDPREPLLDRIIAWIEHPIHCHSDSILWRAYGDGLNRTIVVIAKLDRMLDGVFDIEGRLVQLSGRELALIHVSGNGIEVEGEGVAWTRIDMDKAN